MDRIILSVTSSLTVNRFRQRDNILLVCSTRSVGVVS